MFAVTAFVDEGLGNSSYLVELEDRRALIVDPVRDPSPYLDAAERTGLRLAFAIETHLHADFISGGRELASQGAALLAPTGANLAFEHHGLEDGEEVDLGGLTLRTIATPGHTPEHLSYVIADGGRPLAAFTGGALIVGSIARTDLISPDRTEPLAREAYRSARDRIGTLPDEVHVYPTHGAGSFCSAPAGNDRTTTVGRERLTNDVFVASDEGAFVASWLKGLGTYPPYFLRLRAVNQEGPAVFGRRMPELKRLSVDDIQRSMTKEATVIDARPFEDFAAGHVPGSISIELRPQFASWLGWLARSDLPLVFVLGPSQDRDDVVRQCLKVGYEHIAGELWGGMDAWHRAGLEEATIGLVRPERIEGTPVDVRQAREVQSGRIPGAVHAELGDIERAELPEGPLTLYCGHGQRGMTGASILQRAGRRDLSVLVGGPQDWSSATERTPESS